MLAALIKKQFMELGNHFSLGKRRSKSGSAGGFIFTIALYLIISFSIGAGILGLAYPLGEELLGKGEDWKFFILMDIMGVLLAMLITMFSADLTLFRAKDNETLLAMPIPPGYILLARMFPLYFIALVFTASVTVPAVIVYRDLTGAGFLSIVLNVIIIMALGVLSLGLSSVLGWLVSLLNSRLKGKSIVTTLASLLFLAVYFFVYFQLQKYSRALINSSSAMGDFIQKYLPPLYFLGRAHTGDPLGIALGFLLIAAIFGIIYFALSRSFRGAVISSSKASSSRIGSGEFRPGTQAQELLKKEVKRFTASSSYMMNCGLGTIFMFALSVIAIIKREDLLGLLDAAEKTFGDFSGFVTAILTLLIFAMVSTCYYTMPSISLEGKSIWILQTLPVDPMKIFMAKIKMEYILCLPGTLVFSAVIAVISGMSFLSWAAVIVASLAYITFTAYFGLWINLKRPSLDWTNEAYPIKQGLNPLICLFGEWILTLALAALFFFVGLFIPAEAYLMIVALVLLSVSFIIYRWLKGRGRRIFTELS